MPQSERQPVIRTFLDAPETHSLAALTGYFEGDYAHLTLSDGDHSVTLDFYCGSLSGCTQALLKIDTVIDALRELKLRLTETKRKRLSLATTNRKGVSKSNTP